MTGDFWQNFVLIEECSGVSPRGQCLDWCWQFRIPSVLLSTVIGCIHRVCRKIFISFLLTTLMYMPVYICIYSCLCAPNPLAQHAASTQSARSCLCEFIQFEPSLPRTCVERLVCWELAACAKFSSLSRLNQIILTANRYAMLTHACAQCNTHTQTHAHMWARTRRRLLHTEIPAVAVRFRLPFHISRFHKFFARFNLTCIYADSKSYTHRHTHSCRRRKLARRFNVRRQPNAGSLWSIANKLT